MEKKTRKKWLHPGSPISEESYQYLAEKYRYNIEELKRMAQQLRFGKPKLEMHLIILTAEARKNNMSRD